MRGALARTRFRGAITAAQQDAVVGPFLRAQAPGRGAGAVLVVLARRRRRQRRECGVHYASSNPPRGSRDRRRQIRPPQRSRGDSAIDPDLTKTLVDTTARCSLALVLLAITPIAVERRVTQIRNALTNGSEAGADHSQRLRGGVRESIARRRSRGLCRYARGRDPRPSHVRRLRAPRQLDRVGPRRCPSVRRPE